MGGPNGVQPILYLPIHNQFNVGKRWKDWILLAHYTQSHSLPWQVAHQPIRGNRDENIQSHTIIILFEKDNHFIWKQLKRIMRCDLPRMWRNNKNKEKKTWKGYLESCCLMKINKEVLVEISTSPLVAEKSNEPKKKKKTFINDNSFCRKRLNPSYLTNPWSHKVTRKLCENRVWLSSPSEEHTKFVLAIMD